MEPLHFGSPEQPLFGIYHPPGTGVSRDAWLICSALGQEAIRTYRLTRDVALRLGEAGSHVLRFDYTGCGDSGGGERDYSIHRWLDDIRAAATELTEISGIERVNVIGIRLGATLALLTVGKAPLSGRVIAVDPVVDGAQYVARMRATHASMCIDPDRFGIRRHVSEAPDDLLGFRMERGFLDELESTGLQPERITDALSAHVLSSEEDADLRRLCEDLTNSGSRSVTLSMVDFSPNWSDAPHLERTLIEPGLAAEICRVARS